MGEHDPVLADEVRAALDLKSGGCYVDATFGRGGHTARILAALGGEGRVLALDRDPQAIQAGRERFQQDLRLTLVHSTFADLGRVLSQYAPGRAPDGVLFDLGVSSPQLDEARRGFSFRADGPLDMRMDPTSGQPVADWLAGASVDEMREVIATLGEERFARRVALAIAAARQREPLTRTLQLAQVVAAAVRTREPGKHPATRTFQALRMFINDEPGQLARGLEAALAAVAPGGRIAVISFHSLEDRVVKQFFEKHSSIDPALKRLPIIPPTATPPLKLVGKKLKPSAAELERNPRSRSAILRVAEKVA